MKNMELTQDTNNFKKLTLKEFYSLSTKEHNNYILELFKTPMEHRTGVDNHILKYHTLKPTFVLEEFFIDF